MNSSNYIEIFIINFNGKNTILSTIESLFNSKDVTVKITVIDDCSTDKSLELVKAKFPEVEIHIMPYNTKRANILRNKALELANTEYIFITDNDIKYDSMCLSLLLNKMKSNEKIATCTPRLMYWDQPNRVYMSATKVHYIAAAIAEQRDKVLDSIPEEISPNSGSGICLMRKSITDKIGGFDLNLLQGWGSDGEFYQRLMRAGYKCIYISSAFGLHEDKLDLFSRKYRVIGQTYNRWVFIFTHYSINLIILIIPVLIIYELFEIIFILIKGMIPQYIKGNYLVFKNCKYIIQKRKFVQSIKVVSDKDVLHSGTIYIAPSIVAKIPFVKYINKIFSIIFNNYWKFIKNFI